MFQAEVYVIAVCSRIAMETGRANTNSYLLGQLDYHQSNHGFEDHLAVGSKVPDDDDTDWVPGHVGIRK